MAAARLSSELRSGTRDDHAAVDAAFSRFDLARRGGYGAFLSAQARVLPGLEAMLDPAGLIPGWTGRTDALRQDLAALRLPVRPAIEIALPTAAGARWGAIYVLEGSRLGGVVLARQIPKGLPSAFLHSAHPSGAWRHFLMALDEANPSRESHAFALQAAKAVFAAFALAAEPAVTA